MTDSRVYVALPHALIQIPLPTGWTLVHPGDPLTVMGPERDLELSFLARPVQEDTAYLLRCAWEEVKPGFDVPVLQMVDVPAGGGWNREVHVAYDSPQSNSRVVFAIVRLFGDQSFAQP